MAYTTVYDDVVFIEGDHPDATLIKEIKIDLGSKIGAQLKNITDVKKTLAEKVKDVKGNCLLDFKYGQKTKFWSMDSVAFYGSGKAAHLPQGIYEDIILKKR